MSRGTVLAGGLADGMDGDIMSLCFQYFIKFPATAIRFVAVQNACFLSFILDGCPVYCGGQPCKLPGSSQLAMVCLALVFNI